MLEIKLPLPVKFICAFLYREENIYLAAKKILCRKFGTIDFESERIDFDFTDYYENEMGKPLFRRFLSFVKLQDASAFVKIKLFCIKVEKKFSENGKRNVNIDPGYLTEAKLVLTTTKDYSHRVYLAKGVYAETTLYYNDAKFCDFNTTYPDYRTAKYKQILLSIREIYHGQLKNIHQR
jgi:hypothetical protein